MPKMPLWKTPKNIIKALDDGFGFWEDERWSPLRLTAMSGTIYQNRDIPVAWQLEIDPNDEMLEIANAKLVAKKLSTDGYGWGEFIRRNIIEEDSLLAERLHVDDCEIDTCVIWVELEDDCRKLFESTWKLIFNK